MNAARRAERAGRNLLIALLLGAVIIIAIVIAYVAGRGSSAPSALASTPTSTVPTSSGTSAAGSDSAPTGCLGGSDRNAAMLISTQKQAQQSSFGAVEVAASFFRWSIQFPAPTASSVRDAGSLFVPVDASRNEAALIADYSRNPNPSAGAVPDGTRFYLTTIGGGWLVERGTTSGDQRVSIVAPLVVDGAVSATKTSAETFDMRWVDGAWRVVSLSKADPTRVANGGTTFTSGC